jgi:hypothetical protein
VQAQKPPFQRYRPPLAPSIVNPFIHTLLSIFFSQAALFSGPRTCVWSGCAQAHNSMRKEDSLSTVDGPRIPALQYSTRRQGMIQLYKAISASEFNVTSSEERFLSVLFSVLSTMDLLVHLEVVDLDRLLKERGRFSSTFTWQWSILDRVQE